MSDVIMLNNGKNEHVENNGIITFNIYKTDCIRINKKIRKYALIEITKSKIELLYDEDEHSDEVNEILKKFREKTIKNLRRLVEIMEYESSDENSNDKLKQK